jgi:arginase
MMVKDVKIIEAAYELGAGTRGAQLGPSALSREISQIQSGVLLSAQKETLSQPITENPTSKNGTPFAHNIQFIQQSINHVAASVERALFEKRFPLVFSGDHSNAIGTVTGIADSFPDKKIGVIWVDAHLDLHSPYTTPSGNMHGMAVNALLSDNHLANRKNELNPETTSLWNKIKKSGRLEIHPKIAPENIVFIGTRDYEEEEWELVQHLKIKVFTPDDIRRQGMPRVLDETLKILGHCDLLYTSFDVDSLDPAISTGTGTPAPDGLSYQDAEQVFKSLINHPKTTVFEITEINPLLDNDHSMPRTIAQLLASAW